MTVPPDDLPRAPSGRIPQWVVDDAQGQYSQPASPRDWGAHQLPAPQQNPYAPQVGYRPYSGGMPPGLSRRQQRKWIKQNRPHRARRRGGGGVRFVSILLLFGLMTLVGYRIFSYPGGLTAAWDDLYATITADPLGSRTPKDGPPLAEPPTIENPSSAYEFWNVDGKKDGEEVPTRWSSCEPIRYMINPKYGDEHFVDWVNYSVDEVSAATGLVFEYEGITGQEPRRDAPFEIKEPKEWPPVVIQFANEDQIPDLEGSVAGLALVRQIENSFTGTTRYVTGNIYLDETLLLEPAIKREPAYVHVLRHELAHLVGLGHVDDQTQLMHETPTTNIFQDGDLTGLSKLGGGPCR